MKKVKLYWKLSDEVNGVEGLILPTSELSEYIERDMADMQPEIQVEQSYTITPVWLTDEEVKNMPEYQL